MRSAVHPEPADRPNYMLDRDAVAEVYLDLIGSPEARGRMSLI